MGSFRRRDDVYALAACDGDGALRGRDSAVGIEHATAVGSIDGFSELMDVRDRCHKRLVIHSTKSAANRAMNGTARSW